MPITLTTPETQDDWNAVKVRSFVVDNENQKIVVNLMKGVISGATPIFTEKTSLVIEITGSDFTSIADSSPSGSTTYAVVRNALYTWLEANGYDGTIS